MNSARKLLNHTFIYGLATVLPRMMSFVLVPLYTDVLDVKVYGVMSVVFSWMVLFNVVLAFGMETAFFRFYHKEKENPKVVSTAAFALLIVSAAFLFFGFIFRENFAHISGIDVRYVELALAILVLDALVVVPFAWLRANQQSKKYTWLKLFNVLVNLLMNIFLLLWLPKLNSNSFVGNWYNPDQQITYIFLALLVASGLTLILLLPFYKVLKFGIDQVLFKRMFRYAMPILIAGVAFAINETFDRILLDYLLPKDIADEAIGAYAACYKLAMFMTFFATAFRLGIEPYFFSKAQSKSAPQTYASITHYFIVLGTLIVLSVVVFADLLKWLLIRDESYWPAMQVVPLILAANLFLGIYHNLSVAYKVTDKPQVGAYISIFGAAVTLLINFWLIPLYSYMGSAIATICAYGSMMFLSLYFGQKYLKIPYYYKKSGAYLFISLLFSGLSFYVFRGNYFIGLIFIAIFVGLIIKTEKENLIKIFTAKHIQKT